MSGYNNDLQRRCEDFSIAIIMLIKKESIPFQFRSIQDQLIRSATSIGANYSESQHAISRADFRNKIHIAAKEAQETLYWLKIIEAVEIKDNLELSKLFDEASQITKILSSITNTLRSPVH